MPPERAAIWGRSSDGRAPALQAGGRRFDSGRLHHMIKKRNGVNEQVDLQEFEVAFAEQERHIRCETIEQRQKVLEMLSEMFPNWEIQEELMKGKYREYPNLGMSYGLVVGYCNLQSSDISYAEFMEMVTAEDVSDEEVEAGFLDIISDSFEDLVDRFAGYIVKSRSFPELDGRVVARTIRKKEAGVWIVKLEGVRAYQQLYEDEMERPTVVVKAPVEAVKGVTIRKVVEDDIVLDIPDGILAPF